ncbi:unnamed protein product [Candidula unifasciata]|uniref:Ig-like domain-containing protein n=1 Tax=Candidula unifasciata TaxID=100452 RepID=A0A8S4A315_9EUPU|nr:unnamed protein product [Candidula unifasciata]
MKVPWAWLILVAMAAASTPAIPPYMDNDLVPHNYIDDSDSNRGINNDDNSNELSKSSPCPDSCTCYWGTYPSTAMMSNETQVLDMSHNKLMNITSLANVSDLLVLDLSSNWLRVLANSWLFEHVSKLRVLSLADNGLQSLQHGSFSGLNQLRQLDLSKNIIRRVETHSFSGLGNLEVLRLDNNELYQLKREWFLPLTSLTVLYLGGNYVAKLEPNTFSKLTCLHHLDLSYNSLRNIPDDALNGLNSLKLLNISGNSNLRSVPSKALQPFSSVNILLMDGVAMSRLQPFAVSSIGVAEISLSFLPRLRVVEKSAFYNLTNLRTLQLHDNQNLVFLHPSAFSLLPFLRHLFIHNNGLIAVASQIIISLPALTDLHLHHNPLHCDCNIYWLRKELNKVYQLDYKTKLQAGQDSAQSSNTTTDYNNTRLLSAASPATTTPTSTMNSSDPSVHTGRMFISEPDRVSCFFPAGKASMPLIQLPILYFSPTCPPATLPLFSAFMNVSLGDELWLECQGLGVPAPTLSWILPGGLEVNYSTVSHLTQDWTAARSPVELVEDTLLYIQSAKLSDSGSYGCRAVSPLGDDISTTVVHVQNKPLSLSEVKVSNDYITVSWRGSIPRVQMSDFQLFYRRVSNFNTDSGEEIKEIRDPVFNDTKQLRQNSKEKAYDVIFLHSSIHKCTITGLRPQTTYEVCLMYKQVHPVECHNYTTTLNMHVVSADGIVRISKTHIALAIASVMGAMLLIAVILIVRKVRYHKDYQDPLTEEEKTSIPLEGIQHITTPSTPLTTSRTALLVNSQI